MRSEDDYLVRLLRARDFNLQIVKLPFPGLVCLPGNGVSEVTQATFDIVRRCLEMLILVQVSLPDLGSKLADMILQAGEPRFVNHDCPPDEMIWVHFIMVDPGEKARASY
jgi:hypothetical protein